MGSSILKMLSEWKLLFYSTLPSNQKKKNTLSQAFPSWTGVSLSAAMHTACCLGTLRRRPGLGWPPGRPLSPHAVRSLRHGLSRRSIRQVPKQDDYQEPGPNGLKEFQVCSRGPAEGRPGIRWDPVPLRTDLHVQRGRCGERGRETRSNRKAKSPHRRRKRQRGRPGDQGTEKDWGQESKERKRAAGLAQTDNQSGKHRNSQRRMVGTRKPG